MEIGEDIHDCAGDGEAEGSSEVADEAVGGRVSYHVAMLVMNGCLLPERSDNGHFASFDTGLDGDQGTMNVSICNCFMANKSSRLQCISNTNTRQDTVSNLLPDSGVLIQSREQSQTNSPDDPPEEDTLSVATNPMHDQAGDGATHSCSS